MASVPATIAQKVIGILPPEPAIEAHVLFVVHGMDHRACAQEQQRLEESVGEEMEHSRAERADPGCEEHVAQLRAGRIGDHALDVCLRRADRRREQAGRGADIGDYRHCRVALVSNMGERRQTMNTPAVTIVAA